MINPEREKILEYLQVENEVLREQLGKGRILLNDDQGRRLVEAIPKPSLRAKRGNLIYDITQEKQSKTAPIPVADSVLG